MLVWQCPSLQSHMRATGIYRDDAFKDECVACSLLQVCECVILKKNNNLATPRIPPIPVSNERACSPFDLYGPLRWMPCRRRCFGLVYGGGEWSRRLVAPLPIPLSSYLFLLVLLPLSHSFFFCPQMCLFMCRARWSDREKHLSQWLHLNGFAPVCLR